MLLDKFVSATAEMDEEERVLRIEEIKKKQQAPPPPPPSPPLRW